MNTRKKSAGPEFGDIDEQTASSPLDIAHGRAAGPAYLLDDSRTTLYLTLAGLLEAGIATETAVMLVTTELNTQNKRAEGERLTAFFKSVRETRGLEASGNAVDLAEAAQRCFGKGLLHRDELVLLRGLGYTDNAAAILRTASEIVAMNAARNAPGRPFLQSVRSPLG